MARRACAVCTVVHSLVLLIPLAPFHGMYSSCFV